MKRMEWGRTLNLTETRRSGLVVLAWSLALSSVFTQALSRKAGMSEIDYLLVLAVCFIGGLVTLDIRTALVGCSVALAAAVVSSFLLAILLIPSNVFTPAGSILVQNLWMSIIFKATFPFPIIGAFVTSAIGAIMGEVYL